LRWMVTVLRYTPLWKGKAKIERIVTGR